MLDLASMEALPLGHNHSDFVSVSNDKGWDIHSINPGLNAAQRTAGDIADLSSLLAVKPNASLSSVALTEGSAVEQAIFAAMGVRGHGQRQSVIGFSDSQTGGSMALMQFAFPMCSPSMGWPCIQYPKNAAEEERALEGVRQALQGSELPVAAIVIEPTAAQTGHSVSSSFLAQLHTLAGENGAALIVDETNTGAGATGAGFWQHNGSADYVVFGKRTQVSGYFTSEASYDTASVAGNLINLQRFNIIKNAIESEGLVNRVARVGSSLAAGAEKAAEKSSSITGVRASGTSLWIDTDSPMTAKNLLNHLAANGVLVKGNGYKGVMAKPALTLEEHQGSILTNAIAKF